MKKLSETYKELGIELSFPIVTKDANGKKTYCEYSDGYRYRFEYDDNGNRTYYENSEGFKLGTPKSAKTCEGKVVEVDGIKYKLTAL
jgi:hypothetical protein